MNLADLEKTFWGDQRELPTRVRLARVVRALREEAGPTIRMLEIQAAECFPEINEHGQKHFVRVVMESAAEALKEILGDAGNDQAPAVCEWKELSHERFMRQCSKYPTLSAAGPYCSNCGKISVEVK